MSTTVTYKGNTLATVNNNTKTLKTAGKYMEGDVVLTDVSSSGGYVTQDQDGFIILPPNGDGSPSIGGLEYEEGIWTPSEDVTQPTISFTNIHTTRPHTVILSDVSDISLSTDYSCVSFLYTCSYDIFNHSMATTVYQGRVNNVRYGTSSYSVAGYWLQSNGSDTTSIDFYVSTSGFVPYIGSSFYWRAGRTYKWIAIWAPTT